MSESRSRAESMTGQSQGHGPNQTAAPSSWRPDFLSSRPSSASGHGGSLGFSSFRRNFSSSASETGHGQHNRNDEVPPVPSLPQSQSQPNQLASPNMGSTTHTPSGSVSGHHYGFAPTGSQTPYGHQSLHGHGSGAHTPIGHRAKEHALNIMAKHTFEQASKQQLICPVYVDANSGSDSGAGSETNQRLALQGVALRVAKHDYAVYPRDEASRLRLLPWVTGLCFLNVGAAMIVTSTATEGIVDLLPAGATEVAISASNRIQVVNEAGDLAHARKAQGASFVRREKCLVVWTDEAQPLLLEADKIHKRLVKFLWDVAGGNADGPTEGGSYFVFHEYDNHHQSRNSQMPTHDLSMSGEPFETIMTPGESIYSNSVVTPGQQTPTRSISMPHSPSTPFGELNNGSSAGHLVLSHEKPSQQGSDASSTEEDIEATEQGYEERPTVFISALMHGLAAALALVLSTLQLREALHSSLLDGNWIRMAVAIIVPFYFCIVMFFSDNIFAVIFMLLGPVRQLQINSRYYSGIKPKPLRGNIRLPHITIQMPVYKESLLGVLKPSFESIKLAIKTYELQGGSASIIVSEDGMVLIDEEERAARLAYYEENNITWVGRPKHGAEGFVRAGRFKKASNLNFTYEVLLEIERLMNQRNIPLSNREAYEATFQEVLAARHPDACGNGLERFGDFVLLIDSDTRIPEDCFLDAASEMTRCKDVGILQHCSGVMFVSTSFFEQFIGFFTRLVNFSISYAIANGDVAPFMGHNAYLRWSAMKEIARTEILDDGRQTLKIWSEDHVSEDFVMALDMIGQGYITRWATYANNGYEEGVSLTCDDELNRWQKYGWGVSEMIFKPFYQWFHRGPITPLFNKFIWGRAPIHYKWSSCSYCFSYYAIAVAMPLTLGLTLVGGWLGPDAQAPYLPTFRVFVAVVVVFTLGGTTSLVIVRFRAGVGSLWRLLIENLMWIPVLVVFFGGLSYHVTTALLSHILGLNMTWGATQKDVEMSNFFVEVPQIFKRYWRLFLVCVIVIGGGAVASTDLVPLEWRFDGFFLLFPLFFVYSLHLIFPIVLNPNLVRFSF